MTVATGKLRRHRRYPEPAGTNNAAPLVALQRADGLARVAFKRRGPATVLAAAHQSGCCKLRFPRPLPGHAAEAVLVNTAGGLTDGDRVETRAEWREGTCAVVTTQAAERIYRSRGMPARIVNRLKVADGARAFWLPQETILFDGGRFAREFEADIAESGSLLACESTVFGRTAMGEMVRSGALSDRWRIRQGGRLVFADGLRIEGDIRAVLARPALGHGSGAIASIHYVGDCAETLRDALRSMLEDCEGEGGCSANGAVLLVRVLAAEGAALRRILVRLLRTALGIVDGPAAALPRVWSC